MSEQRHLQLIQLLGKGGFGKVYLAELSTSRGLHQRVAVKVLHDLVQQPGERIARQCDEARILSQLNHDHIVKVFDLTDLHGQPAVIMEYVDGVDIEAITTARGLWSPRAALAVGSSVASALDAAYNTCSPKTGRPLRVVHRDIKPANLLLGATGVVKVLDFGIARGDLDRDAATMDAAMGTIAFMAPEVFQGAEPTPAVDIYALGLTLFRLLSGRSVERMPMQAQRFSARLAEMTDHLSQPAWPRAFRVALCDLIRALVTLDPERRPPAAEVEGRLLELSEAAPGEGLVGFARRTVPALSEERRRNAAPIDLPTEHTTLAWNAALDLPSATRSPTSRAGSGPKVGPVYQSRTGGSGLQTDTARVATWMGAGMVAALVALAFGGLAALLALSWWRPKVQPEPVRTVDEVGAPTAIPAAPSTTAIVAPTTGAPPALPAAPSPPATAAPVAATAPSTAARTGGARCASDHKMAFTSIPFGATLTVDGKRVGVTPAEMSLCDGRHSVRMMIEEQKGERTISVGALLPTHYTWRADGDAWESGL